MLIERGRVKRINVAPTDENNGITRDRWRQLMQVDDSEGTEQVQGSVM